MSTASDWAIQRSFSTRTNDERRRLIDIGANLTDSAFDADRGAVIERAIRAGVDRIVVTGTSIASSAAAIELCSQHAAHLVCTVGVHPHDAGSVGGAWIDDLAQLARSPFVRAIGETGLDFNRNYCAHSIQHSVFDAQLELATRLRLPVFVHDRDTGAAVAQHLERHRDSLQDIVVHCFTGNATQLTRYLELGCHIGITGWICDERRGRELLDLARHIPNDRLLIETDAPYLMPRTMSPRPKSRRNEPANLIWVVRALAQARGESVEELGRTTCDNARRLFRID